MSPRITRYRTIDTSGVTTRKRTKTSNLKNKNSNSLQDFEDDIKNKKKSKINLSPKNNQQQSTPDTTINSLNKQFLTRNTNSEEKKKTNTSNRFRMIKSLKTKTNKSIVYDDSVNNIENISYELFNDSSFNLDMSNKSKRKHDLSLNKTITPKSSPILVNLTPQRSTKTPKISPLHLNSPKTRSRISLTTSRTPRKLMLSVHSPSPLNNSETSTKKRKSNDKNGLNNSSSKRNSKIKINKITTMSKGIRSSSKRISKLSKSSKKVLRSSKRSISKSPKTRLSGDKNTNFVVLKKKELNETNDLNETLTNSNNLSDLYREILSKKPVVLLERIPLLNKNLNPSSKSPNNQHIMNNTFEKTNFNDLNLLTSPRMKRKSFLNRMLFELSSENTSSPVINKKRQRFIDLDLTDNINKSFNNNEDNIINVNENETNLANETYELLEPKTPLLQEQYKKRKAERRNSDDNRDTKRIHLSTSESYINRSQRTILDNKDTKLNSTISLSKPEYITSKTIEKTTIVKNSRKMFSSSPIKSPQNPGFKKTSPFKNNRKMNKTLSSTFNKTKLIGNQKKTDIETRSTKKIPNFSEIHKKMFSKMESLVDNKIRLKKQYEALKSFNVTKQTKPNTQKVVQPLPAKTNCDGYNRFGFKIRKSEATNMILRKQPPNRLQEKREENRVFVKGVRTNRRFELQMKMRNLSD